MMFIGAIIMAVFLFVEIKMSFVLWLAGFLIGMMIATVGAISGIIHLAKSIKADEAQKNK